MIRSEITERMMSYFPIGVGFVENRKDPLNIIMESAGRTVHEINNSLGYIVQNSTMDSMDPAMATTYYYITASFYDTQSQATTDYDVTKDKKYTGTSKVVDTEELFRSREVTGIGRYLTVSGDTSTTDNPDETIVIPGGMSSVKGIAYGFDWENPETYMTDGNSNIYTVDEDYDTTNVLDVSLHKNTFTEIGKDEYLLVLENEVNISESWSTLTTFQRTIPGYVLTAGLNVYAFYDGVEYLLSTGYAVTPDINGTSVIVIDPLLVDKEGYAVIRYTHKTATLNYIPTSSLIIMDILNMDFNGNGTVLEAGDATTEGDYIIDGRVIYFNSSRSFMSSYISEYYFNDDLKAGYLKPISKLHYVGEQGRPYFSID